MISTTACDFANSRVSRAFSARNRSASDEPIDFPERRCGFRFGVKPRARASRVSVHSRICD